MAISKVNPGACGLMSVIEVKRAGGKKFQLVIRSECEMVQKLGKELTELDQMDAFKRITENPVYKKGASCVRHVSCPVPCAILKTLEVEAGLAVPRDVAIVFENSGEKRKEKN